MASRKTLGCELRDLIFYLYEDTLVPELFDLLGEETAIRFIQIFGGMRIEIPSFKRVSELERNIDIYESLSYVNTEETVNSLADHYGITKVWVREIYRNMKRKYPKIERFMLAMNEEKKVRITTKRNVRDEGTTVNQKA